MALTAGTRLGPYEILSALGAGGMGEVYRARDTTLNRHVAIKVLPESFADDPDRLVRFEREAQTLASLNHPNIAHIHGLELSGGVRALVMELVEGEDLSQRIARGALPILEALAIAKQIAEALEAAHEQGIIHRDLKPANIKVRPDGTVKVLDFGLAKAMEPVSGTHNASLTMSPTLSIHATEAGIILGTADYMSPEQAAGRPVDTRSDLWSFGVVLLEMLTGQAVFTGETVSHVLAAVLKTEPDWTTLPAETPASIRRLLRRCLEKDRKRRLANAADARLEIDDAALEPQADARRDPASSARWQRALPVVAGLAALAVGGTAVWSVMRPPSGPPPVLRLTISVPPGGTVGTTAPDPDVALSADGRRVVYAARTEGEAQTQLYVRPLDQLEPTPLRGLPPTARSPFLSPDGEWVGFFDGTQALKKVAITGGPVLLICEIKESARGASWGSKNVVIFATAAQDTGLMEVSADGGEARVLTKPDSEKGEVDHILPEILPGGDAVLFTVVTAGPIENSKIALLDLRTGTWRVLVTGGSNPHYAASGHIVYGVGGTLRAVSFDLDRLEVRGAAVPIVERVVMKLTGATSFSLARDGAMVYLAGEPQSPERTLVWVDRQGREESIPVPRRGYVFARLSPDGERVALDVRDQGMHIWMWSVGGQTFTQLTPENSTDQMPIWTRQSDRVVYSSASPPTLFWRALQGPQPAESLGRSTTALFANSFAPDGRLVVTTAREKTGLDLYLLSPPLGVSRGTPSEPKALLATSFQEANADVSPDGRYLAYQSNESGAADEIHVRPFPDVETNHWLVSSGGGTQPLWSPNGGELFYRAVNGKLMAVGVQTQPTFAIGKTSVAVDRGYFGLGPQTPGGRSYDVSPDGKRFLMIKDAATPTSLARQLVMVQNFFEELKRLAPSK